MLGESQGKQGPSWSLPLFRVHELSMLGRCLVFVLPEAPEGNLALIGQLPPLRPLQSPEGSRGKDLGEGFVLIVSVRCVSEG